MDWITKILSYLQAPPAWLAYLFGLLFLGILIERAYFSKRAIYFGKWRFGPSSSQEDIGNVGKAAAKDPPEPFKLSEHSAESTTAEIANLAKTAEEFFSNMDATSCLALHSFYYESNRHDLALLWIDIAIAKGLYSSKILSFRSASARKLGRLREAALSAQAALGLDEKNADAHYNLAKIYWEQGKIEEAKHHKRRQLLRDLITIPEDFSI